MKWKVPVIILAIIITLGVAAKFAIDKLFSYIMFSALSGTQINMDSLTSLDSLLSDLDKSQVKSQIVPETSEESEDTASDFEENLKDILETDKNGKNSEGNERSQTDLRGDLNEDLNVENLKVESSESGDTISSDYKDATSSNSSKDVIKGGIETSGAASGSRESDVAIAENQNKDRDNNDDNNDGKDGLGTSEHKSHLHILPEQPEKDEMDQMKKIEETKEVEDNQGKNNSVNNNTRNNHTGSANDEENEIDQDIDDNSIKVTPDKIKEAEKKVSTNDKAKALGILFSKLKPSDISILIDMARGGEVGDAELTRAKQIIKERVTEEEKEILKSLFNKYEYLLYE